MHEYHDNPLPFNLPWHSWRHVLRVRAIRWFEQNHPAEFDLYGTLWEHPYFAGRLARLNLGLHQFYARFPHLLRRRRFPSHRGSAPSKHAVMRQYQFAICYENAVFPGYVTEKIFDALFAGCVPIYLGAPDITAQLPAEIFIDKRPFKDYAALPPASAVIRPTR